jgi:hypothetical protein
MKNLRALGTFVVLTSLLCLLAFVVETNASACGPLDPGQVETPPCATAQASSTGETSTPPAAAPGQLETPPASGEVSLTELASSVLLSIVSLF